jgi:O-acetylserine/cysteine efflux transporter
LGEVIVASPASQVTPFALAVPIVGMASSAVSLGETFTSLKIIAAGLILIGLVGNVMVGRNSNVRAKSDDDEKEVSYASHT